MATRTYRAAKCKCEELHEPHCSHFDETLVVHPEHTACDCERLWTKLGL